MDPTVRSPPWQRGCVVDARRLRTLASAPGLMALGALALAFSGWVLVDRKPVRSASWREGGDAILHPSTAVRDSAELAREADRLRAERKRLEARVVALQPRGNYVVVDRGNNRIYLRRGDSVLVDAPASTGSGDILQETVGAKRTWVFDTPPGRFSILSEREDPVWTKPDWAFLEEGLPVPQRLADRRDYGSLGEYALDLGDGYMIHGTLYERLLGRSVTHGCVRVGREPLRAIVSKTRVGTPVFIF